MLKLKGEKKSRQATSQAGGPLPSLFQPLFPSLGSQPQAPLPGCGCPLRTTPQSPRLSSQKAHVYGTPVKMMDGARSREPTLPVSVNSVTGGTSAQSPRMCHPLENQVRTSSQTLYPHSPFPTTNCYSIIPCT